MKGSMTTSKLPPVPIPGLGIIINVLTVILLSLSITKEVAEIKAMKEAEKEGTPDEGH
jgi:hypothetical protein